MSFKPTVGEIHVRQGSPKASRSPTHSPKRGSFLLAPSLGKPSSPTAFTRVSTSQTNNPSRIDIAKKNSMGGVLVTSDEIQAAFSMLDIEKNGAITLPALKKRLGVLFPDMSAKEYRFLMNNKKELTVDDLKELLLENEISNFDPVTEAFRVFEDAEEEVISAQKLRRAFTTFGFGELSDEELDILTRVRQFPSCSSSSCVYGLLF